MIIKSVLILIVVDDGLLSLQCFSGTCLNPYCSGRWPRTAELNKIRKDAGLS